MNDAVFGISTAWIIANVWSVLVALGALVAGWLIAGFVSKWATTLIAQRLRSNATIAPLVGQVLRYAVLFVTLIIVLGQFGVETASILAVLGAAGLAVALALQGTLSNIAAGIMLVFLRPFNVGDYIDADGIVGTVVEVGLFATTLKTIEGVYLFAPNSKLSNARIANYTRERSRVVELKFNVPRSADIATVRSDIATALSTTGTPPEILIDTLEDTTVTLLARIPVASPDWWRARSELQERLKLALDNANNYAPPAATTA